MTSLGNIGNSGDEKMKHCTPAIGCTHQCNFSRQWGGSVKEERLQQTCMHIILKSFFSPQAEHMRIRVLSVICPVTRESWTPQTNTLQWWYFIFPPPVWGSCSLWISRRFFVDTQEMRTWNTLWAEHCPCVRLPSYEQSPPITARRGMISKHVSY